MAESMTGYGRGEYRSERYHVGVEIKSVNHRFLEIKLRLPRELNASENVMRAALRRRFARGAVDATVQLERQEGARRFAVDEALLGEVAAALAAAAQRLGIEGRFELATLAQFREIFRFEAQPDDLAELEAGALAAFEAACDQLEGARRREGAALAAAVAAALKELRDVHGRMLDMAPQVSQQLKESIAARAAELFGQTRLAPDRLEQEAALLAMRSDVTEELTRLGGHLGACDETLAGEGPAGRQMDFLLQEMHRELNTAAAKANTGALAQLAIRGKLELEKVREQVQNLE
ncbi:MAG TPA: YicC/YloC family endoribonuclease [Candidatus Methanoperedens sp.]|nr:YicC/YloC family endoribonuclease [Candidatus Methanoperedens sp.]